MPRLSRLSGPARAPSNAPAGGAGSTFCQRYGTLIARWARSGWLPPPFLPIVPLTRTPKDARALRRHAALALAVLLGCLLLGWNLQVQPDKAQWAGWSGPHCLLSETLGDHSCPGCGLTRASALALQGEWRAASAMHLGGLVVVVVFGMWSLVYARLWLRGQVTPPMRLALRVGRYALALGIGVGWLLRIA